jgi:hypothetical protein
LQLVGDDFEVVLDFFMEFMAGATPAPAINFSSGVFDGKKTAAAPLTVHPSELNFLQVPQTE